MVTEARKMRPKGNQTGGEKRGGEAEGTATLGLGRLGVVVHRQLLVVEAGEGERVDEAAAATIGSTCEAEVARGNTMPKSNRTVGATPEASDGPRRRASREQEGARWNGEQHDRTEGKKVHMNTLAELSFSLLLYRRIRELVACLMITHQVHACHTPPLISYSIS